jgi:hypothetical protein
MAWKAVKWVYPENGRYYTTGDFMCGDKMAEPNDEKAPDSVITMVGGSRGRVHRHELLSSRAVEDGQLWSVMRSDDEDDIDTRYRSDEVQERGKAMS